MSDQALQWTDGLGRTYPYRPYQATPLADAAISFSSETTLALAEASRALGSVPGLPMSGVAAVLYRSESNASSLIEGVGPGTRRILEAEVANENEINDEQARRVVSNLEALKDSISTPLPVRSEDILRWHGLLMKDHPRMRPETIGAYRTEQNWIGGDAFGPKDAEFIPPRPEDLQHLIEDLEAFCARTDLTPVAHAALAHARFEVIHPFADGNGRVGRMLLQQVLIGRAKLDCPVPVSVPWARDTDRYIAGLRAFQKGATDSWLLFASWSIIEAVDRMTQMSGKLSSLLDGFRTRLNTRGQSVTARVIDDLAEHPIVDTRSVAKRYKVTPQTAHASLIRLAEAGILGERSFAGRRKGRPRRIFAATELIDLLAG